MASMPITASTQELANLINQHIGDLMPSDPAWRVADSPLSGRGVFARRPIQAGEVIFRERTLLVGPTAQKKSPLNTCTLCYRRLDGPIEKVLCPRGCSLPVCPPCSELPRHEKECFLFRKWVAKDLTRIVPEALRILSVVRCFFLTDSERQLLYAMQANADRYYVREVERAAQCYQHFPSDPKMLEYFHRTICAFNTNAYESSSNVDGHEVMLRALFPLAGLLNHHCTPNAGHHFDNAETIVVTATRDIAAGEEITTTYTKVLWGTLARKMFLSMTKHFMCHCSRCQDPSVSLAFNIT